jgi:hypothetical protein
MTSTRMKRRLAVAVEGASIIKEYEALYATVIREKELRIALA